MRPGPLRLLQLAVLVAGLDRLAIGPLLRPIALDFHVSIAATAGVATVYLIFYGLTQPVAGFLSDRRGRVKILRIALTAAVGAGLLSAAAPSLPALFAARALSGAAYAALFPIALVYIADTFRLALRQRAITDILVAAAISSALAVIGAGALAGFLSWRLAFVIPALGAALLVHLTRTMPEPPSGDRVGPAEQARAVLRHPWAICVILLAVPEGAVLFGFLTYLAPELESGGMSAARAGLAVSSYGIGVLAAVPLLRRLAHRWRAFVLILTGGACTAAGYALLIFAGGWPALTAAGLVAGIGFTIMHSTVQTWATEVAPEARGTTVSLFSSALFLGGGAGTALVAPLAGAGDYPRLFAIATLVALGVVPALALGRRRFGDPGPRLTAGAARGTL